MLTVVNRIYTRKQQSSEERRNIFGKSGKNLWGIDTPFDPTPKGGGTPQNPFASTGCIPFAVWMASGVYFNYRHNLSDYFVFRIYKYTFASVAPFFLFSFPFSLIFFNIVAQRFNYINLRVFLGSCIFEILKRDNNNQTIKKQSYENEIRN